jgi:transposase
LSATSRAFDAFGVVKLSFNAFLRPSSALLPTQSITLGFNRLIIATGASIEKQRNCLVAQSEPCKRLKALESVGDVCATLLYINLGNGSEFKNGRQASAYVGVTPKQYSSGGKVSIKGIDKVGGNKELRAALYQGALAVVSALPDKPKTTKQLWLFELVQRAGVKRACIALANKTVRTAWALMNTDETYKPKALAC